MSKFWFVLLLFGVLSLSGCTGDGGLFSTCDPRFTHCDGSDPKMQDEIADEVGQML